MSKRRGIIVGWVVGVFLVVACGAVAYYVIGDIFLNKKPEPTAIPEVVKPKFSEVCAPHEKMCLKMPDDWTADIQENTYPAIDSEMAKGMDKKELTKTDAVVLRSPNGLIVGMASGIMGIGGICEQQEEGRLWPVKHTNTALGTYSVEVDGAPTGMIAATPFVVSFVTSNKDGTSFTPSIEFTRAMVLRSSDEQTACAAYLSSLIPGKNIEFPASTGNSGHGFVSVSTSAPFLSSEKVKIRSYPTLGEAKRALDSNEYKQAFDIIASAHYK